MGLLNRELLVFHTNDIHSALDNVARIETLLEQYREQYQQEEMLLLDLGDFMDRMSLETEGTDGLVHRDLLNRMQYDVITLGNNEGLSFTHEQLTHIYEAPTTFKVVCCNMSPLNDDKLNWLFKSTIIEKNGLKIACIGATINYTDFYKLLNWNAADPIRAIKEQVDSLREQADVVIVLSHLGIRLDEQLVEACPDIDILIGAHTHHVFNPAKKHGQTLMCAGGMGGAYLGVVKISAADASQGLQLSGELIPTAEYEQHKDILNIINQHKEAALTQLDKEVAMLNYPLLADDFTESQLPNLLAISLRQWCGTSLSIVNSGQIISSLEAGRVTLRDIHAICPSPINPCILKIKGIYIREALEQSIQEEFRAKVIKGYGFRGNRLGYLAVSGIKIEFKSAIEVENHTKLTIYIHDQLLDDDELYSVASIDMFTFGIGYTSLSHYEDVEYFVPEYIRHLLANTLTNRSLIEESKENNWFIVP